MKFGKALEIASQIVSDVGRYHGFSTPLAVETHGSQEVKDAFFGTKAALGNLAVAGSELSTETMPQPQEAVELLTATS